MPIVDSILVESEFFPPIFIDKPLEPGQPNFWLSILKPKVTVSAFGQNIVSKPYGEPEQYWNAIKFILLFVVGFFLILFLTRK